MVKYCPGCGSQTRICAVTAHGPDEPDKFKDDGTPLYKAIEICPKKRNTFDSHYRTSFREGWFLVNVLNIDEWKDEIQHA